MKHNAEFSYTTGEHLAKKRKINDPVLLRILYCDLSSNGGLRFTTRVV